MNRKTFLHGAAAIGFGASLSSAVSCFRQRNELDWSQITAKKTLIEQMCETIIPSTDTPGAGQTGVANYIVLMIRDCADRKEQHAFFNGLAQVEKYCLTRFGCSFVACDPEQRKAVLIHFEERYFSGVYLIRKISTKIFGEPFIVMFKRLTVQGYCTSRVGANDGLAYDYIPVVYDGCVSLKPGQKAWATK